MAANSREVVASSTARKKKLPSMEKLIEHGKEALGSNRKKQRKPVHYEYCSDPTTGWRNCKNTYMPRSLPSNRLSQDQAKCSKSVSEDQSYVMEELDVCSISTSAIGNMIWSKKYRIYF